MERGAFTAAEAGGAVGLSGVCAACAGAAAALEACAEFLKGIDEASYARPCAVMHGGTIGQHVRHALDHYGAALAGARGDVIAYDRRERGTVIETDLAAALALLREIREGLRGIDAARSAAAVRVRVMVDGSSGAEVELGSTLGREVAFAAHHAVHHHAMMSAIGKAMGLRVPEGFEKAPATAFARGG